MLLTEEEIKERMQSPLNLLNRLRVSSSQKPQNLQIVGIPPTADEIISDLEEKIKRGSVKSKATNLMIKAMDALDKRLPEVSRPEKLAQIASEMGKVINQAVVRVEDNSIQAQIIVYSPKVTTEEEYDVIDAKDEG
ncbi:MAG: hypothetical protein ACREBU_09315 [Nitrososphaera sp.]